MFALVVGGPRYQSRVESIVVAGAKARRVVGSNPKFSSFKTLGYIVACHSVTAALPASDGKHDASELM